MLGAFYPIAFSQRSKYISTSTINDLRMNASSFIEFKHLIKDSVTDNMYIQKSNFCPINKLTDHGSSVSWALPTCFSLSQISNIDELVFPFILFPLCEIRDEKYTLIKHNFLRENNRNRINATLNEDGVPIFNFGSVDSISNIVEYTKINDVNVYSHPSTERALRSGYLIFRYIDPVSLILFIGVFLDNTLPSGLGSGITLYEYIKQCVTKQTAIDIELGLNISKIKQQRFSVAQNISSWRIGTYSLNPKRKRGESCEDSIVIKLTQGVYQWDSSFKISIFSGGSKIDDLCFILKNISSAPEN
ncbi:hypothetical protein CDIK_3306 [Cucumispora dikerogammari]|nr:hypothetical protein CDIK_3306 [Cucumispora dikerogammari]